MKKDGNEAVPNELVELNENEKRLLPVIDDFDRIIKSSEDNEEIDELEKTVQKLSDDF